MTLGTITIPDRTLDPYVTPPALPVPVVAPAAAAPSNGAQELVSGGFASAQTYANNAFNTAIGFMDSLRAAATAISALPTIVAELPSISGTIGDFVAPACLRGRTRR
jgi:hypothetical protein